MEFQKCSVNGVAYGEGVTEAQHGAAKRRGEKGGMDPAEESEKLAMTKEDMLQKLSQTFNNRWIQPDRLTLISPTLANGLADHLGFQRGHIIAFFLTLAICHSVLPDQPDPQMRPFHLDYKAESPDEAALVAAARDVGIPFVARTNGMIDIKVMGNRSGIRS
jgi:phospholipid-translocating ATPase